MKESFVVRTEWAEQIDLLTDEQAGQLLKAWFRYHMDESVDVHDPVVMMAFSFNRSYFEECASRWAATVMARQEAGKKGGRPKKANGLSEKAKKPNAFLGFDRLEEEKRKTAEEPEHKWVNGKRRKVTDSGRQAETSAAERTQANMERMRRMLEDMNREDGPCG